MRCPFLAHVPHPGSGPQGLGLAGASVVQGKGGGLPSQLDLIVKLESAAYSCVTQGKLLNLSETQI